jgi:hypothetical protein
MPPAIVPLALVALGVPAALRAIAGRPRTLGSAWLAAAAAAAIAQAAGEILGLRFGVLGDAQLLLAAVLCTLTSTLVALLERREG